MLKTWGALSAFVVLAAAVPARADYLIQWRQVGGGWKSPSYRSAEPACPHTSPQAACNGQDFRGTYGDGQVTTLWRSGCGRAPIQITCRVTDRR